MNETFQTSCQRSPCPPIHTRGPLVLLAEDNTDMRALLSRGLQDAGYSIVEARHGFDLLLHLADPTAQPSLADIALIVTDLRMPGLTGLEALEGAGPHFRLPPVVLITAFGDEATHAEAHRRGAELVIDKPFDLDDFLAQVRRLAPLPHRTL